MFFEPDYSAGQGPSKPAEWMEPMVFGRLVETAQIAGAPENAKEAKHDGKEASTLAVGREGRSLLTAAEPP